MNSIPAIPSEIHAPILHLGLGALDVRLSPIAITVGPAAENIVEQARTAWLASSAGRAPDALATRLVLTDGLPDLDAMRGYLQRHDRGETIYTDQVLLRLARQTIWTVLDRGWSVSPLLPINAVNGRVAMPRLSFARALVNVHCDS